MLTDTELGEVMSSARRSLFRLETLDRYEVPIDGSDISVYLTGGEQPLNPEKLAWEEHLRAERTAGIWRHRVHLIDTTHGLCGYLRYECEWGYTATTAAGEGVRILDLPTASRPRELTEIDHDFWLIDGERVVRMHYGADATFVGGELMPADTVPSYRAAREAAWIRAEEFTSWWAAHPQYHRANQPVALTREDRLSHPARQPDELSTSLRQLRSDADLPGVSDFASPRPSHRDTEPSCPVTEAG